MARRKPRKRTRRFVLALWALAGYFALGYFPTAMLPSPVISMTAAASFIIPFGSTSRTLRQAVVRGWVLGLTAGIGVWAALNQGGRSAAYPDRPWIFLAATAVMCVVVSGVFGQLAIKRRDELFGR